MKVYESQLPQDLIKSTKKNDKTDSISSTFPVKSTLRIHQISSWEAWVVEIPVGDVM